MGCLIDSSQNELLACFFLILGCATSSSASPPPHESAASRGPLKFILGEENLGEWKNQILEAAGAPGPANAGHQNELVLAAKRTNRPDILQRFKRYRGGWDISNKHYWASVVFTGAFGFILATLWFVLFGLALIVHHCGGWRIIKGKGSHRSENIWFIFLMVFTCTTAIGCILLSVGQNEFHGQVLHTVNYVVNQSDYTVQTLRNVTQYLSLAKNINVAQVFLPSDVLDDVDKLSVDLKSAADTLEEKTSENSVKIKKLFNVVRSTLITVAAIMLVLALTGLVLSVLGHKHAIHIFIVSGWLLAAVTFILCGVFVIFSNATSDTCMAMKEWVDNPHAETALSNILPCVDQRTTSQTLIQSKQVINDFVDVVNRFIYNYANSNTSQNPSHYNPYNYNQSGPMMPPLCYPYDGQLQDRQCTAQEVSIANASEVWKNYTCTVSEIGICTSVGRVTPDIYSQLVAAVNESYALEYYAPPLLSFKDCNFVRDTFQEITSSYCPPFEHYLQMVDAGLGLISVGVMLCLILWILYANRLGREEVFVKILLPVKGNGSRSLSNGETAPSNLSPANAV